MRRLLPALLLTLVIAAPALADDCGCGGPKAYYMQKYGTIKPPFDSQGVPASTQSPAPAAGTAPAGTATVPVNPPATGQGG